MCTSYLSSNAASFLLFRIKFLVLDEADRLMDGRFDEQIQTIWSSLPDRRQTLLFSATITDRLQKMKDLASSKVRHRGFNLFDPMLCCLHLAHNPNIGVT